MTTEKLAQWVIDKTLEFNKIKWKEKYGFELPSFLEDRAKVGLLTFKGEKLYEETK